MAELAKKLHFLKNGSEETAKAYSTTAEAGSEYITNKIDGVNAYVALGATSDNRATKGRVIKGGATKAILSSGKIPYTLWEQTKVGTHTFTVPAGVTRIRVAVCGGGGGYAAVNLGHYGWFTDFRLYTPYTAATGGTSSFGSLISASGGVGGTIARIYSSSDQGYCLQETNGSGGSPSGAAGSGGGNGYNSATTCYGGEGWAYNFNGSHNGRNTWGCGGSCYLNSGRGDQIGATAAGGSAGYSSRYFNVTPGTTYSVVVGGAGDPAYINLGGYGDTVPTNTTNAWGGFVLVAYGGDI